MASPLFSVSFPQPSMHSNFKHTLGFEDLVQTQQKRQGKMFSSLYQLWVKMTFWIYWANYLQLVSLLMWLLENSLLRLWLSVSGICNQLLSESPVRCSKTLWEERAYSSKSLILLKLFHFLISNLTVALCLDKKKKNPLCLGSLPSKAQGQESSSCGWYCMWLTSHLSRGEPV